MSEQNKTRTEGVPINPAPVSEQKQSEPEPEGILVEIQFATGSLTLNGKRPAGNKAIMMLVTRPKEANQFKHSSATETLGVLHNDLLGMVIRASENLHFKITAISAVDFYTDMVQAYVRLILGDPHRLAFEGKATCYMDLARGTWNTQTEGYKHPSPTQEDPTQEEPLLFMLDTEAAKIIWENLDGTLGSSTMAS